MSQRRRQQRPSRSVWQRISGTGWVLLGLLIGLAGALYYTWVINPLVYTNASPARLSDLYKSDYIFLVAQSLAMDGDLAQAEQRLAALEDPLLPETVNSLLEQYLREQQPAAQVRILAELAQQLGAEGDAVAIFAPTPAAAATPTLIPTATQPPPPTAVPSPTATTTPTPTPTATAVPPTPERNFTNQLLDQQRLCSAETGAESSSPLITVLVLDTTDEQEPGTAVLVRWDNQENQFYTGFKPTYGPGYADFLMEPDTSYTVSLVAGSPEVSGLRIEPCPDGAPGGWALTFQRTD
jgi:hypothetical protein